MEVTVKILRQDGYDVSYRVLDSKGKELFQKRIDALPEITEADSRGVSLETVLAEKVGASLPAVEETPESSVRVTATPHDHDREYVKLGHLPEHDSQHRFLKELPDYLSQDELGGRFGEVFRAIHALDAYMRRELANILERLGQHKHNEYAIAGHAHNQLSESIRDVHTAMRVQRDSLEAQMGKLEKALAEQTEKSVKEGHRLQSDLDFQRGQVRLNGQQIAGAVADLGDKIQAVKTETAGVSEGRLELLADQIALLEERFKNAEERQKAQTAFRIASGHERGGKPLVVGEVIVLEEVK